MLCLNENTISGHAFFGTRLEAIKMVPLYYALKASSDFQTTVCVSSQHRQLLDQVLGVFDIFPDFGMDLMKSAQDLFDFTIERNCQTLLGLVLK